MSSDRRELEQLWKQKWEAAKLKLEQAAARVRETESAVRSGSVPEPQGFDAYSRALEAETIALTEYSHALRIYTDLVVHGKLPEEASKPKTRNAGSG